MNYLIYLFLKQKFREMWSTLKFYISKNKKDQNWKNACTVSSITWLKKKSPFRKLQMMMEDGFEFPKYVTITKGKTKYHPSIKIRNSSSPRQDVLNNQFKKSPKITNNSNMPKGGGLTKPRKITKPFWKIWISQQLARS